MSKAFSLRSCNLTSSSSRSSSPTYRHQGKGVVDYKMNPRKGEGLRNINFDSQPKTMAKSSIKEMFRDHSPGKSSSNVKRLVHISPKDLKSLRVNIKQGNIVPTSIASPSRPTQHSVVHSIENPDDFMLIRRHGEGAAPIFSRPDIKVNEKDERRIVFTDKTARNRSRSPPKGYVISAWKASETKYKNYPDGKEKYYSDRKSKYSPERGGSGHRYYHKEKYREREPSPGCSKYETRRHSPIAERRHRHRESSTHDRDVERHRARSYSPQPSTSKHKTDHHGKLSGKVQEKSGYYVDDIREKDRVKREKERLLRLANRERDETRDSRVDRNPRSPTERTVRSRSHSRDRPRSRDRLRENPPGEGGHMFPHPAPAMYTPHPYMGYYDPYMFPPMGPLMYRPYMPPRGPHPLPPRPPMGPYYRPYGPPGMIGHPPPWNGPRPFFRPPRG